MSGQTIAEGRNNHSTGEELRGPLLTGARIQDRRLELAGVSTAVLEGGEGRPVVLLHGQGNFAAMWVPTMADLASTHHVIAPDLPGLGASTAPDPPGRRRC